MAKGKGKPKMQIRKPPSDEPDPEKVAAFIGGEKKEKEAPAKDAPQDTDEGKKLSERTTIYFEESVSRDLRVHCAVEREAMSQVVNDAVRQYLAEHAD